MPPIPPALARGRIWWLLAGTLAVLVLAGCSALPQFPDAGSGPWRPRTEPELRLAPQPRVPGAPAGPGAAPEAAPEGPSAAPGECAPSDPAVIASCLEPVSAIVALHGVRIGLVAERTTGRILRVVRNREPVPVADLEVDASGDGGLTGMTISPTYAEDGLLFAYITTPTDNRVVRIAEGEPPEPILTGIPRGESGNAGALAVGPRGMLLVATGDAGKPALAADPDSLAGKVLRIDTSGNPAPGNPDPASPVIARGLHRPGGLCAGNSSVWATDRAPEADLLQRVRAGRPLGAGEWVWPDQPGASGCVVVHSRVQVALSSGGMYVLRVGPGGHFVGRPRTVPLERYGKLAAAAVSPDGSVWLGTVNKDGGDPIPTDERVFSLPPRSGGGARD